MFCCCISELRLFLRHVCFMETPTSGEQWRNEGMSSSKGCESDSNSRLCKYVVYVLWLSEPCHSFFFVIYLFFYSTSCSVNLYAIFLTWDPGDNPDDSVHTLDGYNAHITTWSGLDWSHIKKKINHFLARVMILCYLVQEINFLSFLLLNLRTHPRANVSSQGQV